MDEDKIKQRQKYMREYYLKNKDRYKNGKYIKKKTDKDTPKFKIIKQEITIKFE